MRAARGFGRWLRRAGRAAADPFELLPFVPAAADVRHGRGAFAPDELGRLVAAARASGRGFRGLAGADRAALYLTAAYSGFRARGLANLTPADFRLGGPGRPRVTLPARFSKNGRTWLAGRRPGVERVAGPRRAGG